MGWFGASRNPAMRTWGDVSAPDPYSGYYATLNDIQRQKVPQPRFAGASGGVFTNQQGNPSLPDGKIQEIPGEQALAINATPYMPPETLQSSGTAGPFTGNITLQQAMGSMNASPGPASVPGFLSNMPGPWGDD